MKNVFIYLAAAIVFSFSCKKNALLTPSVSNTTIQVNKQKGATLNIPYADTAELKQYSSNKEVLHYGLAKKIALLELQETGFVTDMGWEGYHLSDAPVLILDLNSLPKYYDYIALNTQEQAIGFVRVYATRENSTLINKVSAQVPDYKALVTKNGAANSALFEDWQGNTYVGIKTKAGSAPIALVDTRTGEALPSEENKELKGTAIIDYIEKNMYTFISDNGKTISKEKLRAGLSASLQSHTQQAAAFWEELAQHEADIAALSEEEITTGTKFFGWLRIFFPGPFRYNDDKTIERYMGTEGEKLKYREYYKKWDWCGPFVCGYIYNVRYGSDQIGFFENYNKRHGWINKIFDGAMTIGIMHDAMYSITGGGSINGGGINIDTEPIFTDMRACSHILFDDRPAIRFTKAGKELHWTLAYGVKRTGTKLWANYFFYQVDNGTLFGINPKQGSDSRWFDIWYLVRY